MERERKIVAVVGSDQPMWSGEVELAVMLGGALAENGFDVLTGGGPGLPYCAAWAAARRGAQAYDITSGYFTAGGYKKEVAIPWIPVEHRQFLEGHGADRLRWATAIVRNSDAVAVVSGKDGTLREFVVACAENKPIGVLEGSGGVCDIAREVAALVRNRPRRDIIYSHYPQELAWRLRDNVCGGDGGQRIERSRKGGDGIM